MLHVTLRYNFLPNIIYRYIFGCTKCDRKVETCPKILFHSLDLLFSVSFSIVTFTTSFPQTHFHSECTSFAMKQREQHKENDEGRTRDGKEFCFIMVFNNFMMNTNEIVRLPHSCDQIRRSRRLMFAKVDLFALQ